MLSATRSNPLPDPVEREREEAWVGDAVLTLYAREAILRAHGAMDAELSSRMTSNRFLSAFGHPTAVEAQVGRIYRARGLQAAFEWVETELMPLFKRQEEKRARKERR